MITARQLVRNLEELEPDTQVWVQLDVEGVSHRLPLGSMKFAASGIALVAEPLPVPDPIIPPVEIPGIVQPEHEHTWTRDEIGEIYRCTTPGDCLATVTYERLIKEPIPATEADGILLLNHLADQPSS